MGKINYARVVVGGLLAGVVFNIGEGILNGVIVADEWEAIASQMGIDMESSGMVTMYVLLNFAIGLLLVWLYAAIRPRFGAGPKTAIIAGLYMWLSLWFVGFGSMSLSFAVPSNVVVTTLVWGIVEICLAALVGGWAYREEEQSGVEPAA